MHFRVDGKDQINLSPYCHFSLRKQRQIRTCGFRCRISRDSRHLIKEIIQTNKDTTNVLLTGYLYWESTRISRTKCQSYREPDDCMTSSYGMNLHWISPLTRWFNWFWGHAFYLSLILKQITKEWSWIPGWKMNVFSLTHITLVWYNNSCHVESCFKYMHLLQLSISISRWGCFPCPIRWVGIYGDVLSSFICFTLSNETVFAGNEEISQ